MTAIKHRLQPLPRQTYPGVKEQNRKYRQSAFNVRQWTNELHM